MRSVQSLLGLSALLSAFSAISQESLCNPCVDAPNRHRSDALRTLTIIREDAAPASARWTFSRIREMGGELADIAHDCEPPNTAILEQISFTVKACRWGGRYPALLFATTDADNEDSLVVLASNGSTLEVLFDKPPSQAVFGVFDGLLLEDFEGMFLEFSNPPED